MTEAKKKSVVFVVALVVLAAIIVVVAAALSGCSGDENNTADPTPTETAAPEQTAEPAQTGTNGSTAASAGKSSGSTAKSPASGGSSSSSSNKTPAKNDTTKDNGRDKVEYVKNYGDNVEKGMEQSTDEFVDSLKDIGNAYNKGDVEGITNTVDSFTKGLGDYLGGIRDTIIP